MTINKYKSTNHSMTIQ